MGYSSQANVDTNLCFPSPFSLATDLPPPDAPNRFYQYIRRVRRRIDKYDDVFTFLLIDGWPMPPPELEPADDD
jgi:hypothetical protein